MYTPGSSFVILSVILMRNLLKGESLSKEMIIVMIVEYISDPSGRDLAAVQNTPIATNKQDTCIFFNVDVYIQKTVDSLPPGECIHVIVQTFLIRQPGHNVMTGKQHQNFKTIVVSFSD